MLPLDGFADADLVAPDGWDSADRPVLYLSKAQDGDDGPITTAAHADVTWARFDGACHETFTGSPVTCSTYEKEDGLDDVAVYLTSFAAAQILDLTGEPYASVLDGATVVDDRITVQSTP